MFPDTTSPEADADLPVFIILRQLKDGPCYDFWLEMDGSFRLWKVQAGAFRENGKMHGMELPANQQLQPFAWEPIALRNGTRLGPEIIWDAGEYRFVGDQSGATQAALEKGEVHIWLQGERLRGQFALLRASEGDGGAAWLLRETSARAPEA